MIRRYSVRAIEVEIDVAQAINDRGDVVGARLSPRGRRAVKCAQGNCHELGTLGGSFSIARGLNNRGEVVGNALTAGDVVSHGFVANGLAVEDLNGCLISNEGWEILDAVDINDSGQILCLASRAGRDQLVVLEPRTGAVKA